MTIPAQESTTEPAAPATTEPPVPAATLTDQAVSPIEPAAPEVQATEPAKVEPPAAPEYTVKDFELPVENFDAKLFEDYVNEAKELGLTKDQVIKQIEKGKQITERFAQEQFNKVEAVKSEWLEAVNKDPEIGGDKLQGVLAAAGLVMKEVSPEFKNLLTTTGLGNHPELIKIFYRYGKLLQQDTVEKGQPSSMKSLADRMYNSN